MKRLLWVGVGVAAALYATRWLRQQRRKLSPQAIGATVGDVAADARKLAAEAIREARSAAAQKERELRGEVLEGRETSSKR